VTCKEKSHSINEISLLSRVTHRMINLIFILSLSYHSLISYTFHSHPFIIPSSSLSCPTQQRQMRIRHLSLSLPCFIAKLLPKVHETRLLRQFIISFTPDYRCKSYSLFIIVSPVLMYFCEGANGKASKSQSQPDKLQVVV
jgi:hypothetical protein